MEKLNKRRSIIKGQLTKINNYVSVNSDELSYDELKTRLDHAHRLYSEFIAVEDNIFEMDAEVLSEMDIIDESYFKIIAKIQSSMRSNVNNIPKLDESINATTTSHAVSDFKLPALSMPTFDGNLREWQSFFDIFTSTIHENISLTPAQKFKYLKGLLKGSAYDLVRHFRVDDASYLEAYQRLVKRYNKKKPIVEAYIKSLLDQPKIHKGTASTITQVHDQLDEVIRGLKALGQDAESRDAWLIYIIVEKLDEETKRVWKYEMADIDSPTVQELLDFLLKRMSALTDHTACSSKTENSDKKFSKSQSTAKLFHTSIVPSCPLCAGETHRLFECSKFIGLTIPDRREFLKIKSRCFNCLSDSHSTYQCKTRRRCRTCNKKHNTLVHLDSQANANVIPESTSKSTAINAHVSCCNQDISEIALDTLDKSQNAMLPTVVLQIQSSFNTWQDIRGLLDSASTRSFITESCVNRLHLPRSNGRVIIETINQSRAGHSRGLTNIKLRSRIDQSYAIDIAALIVPNITSNLPPKDFEADIQFTEMLPLADPTFNQSGSIDILLGCDIFLNSITEGKLTEEGNNMVALNTKFGWIIGGLSNPTHNDVLKEKVFFTIEEEINIDRLLRRFWEIEEIVSQSNFSTEEKTCITTYINTTTRNDQGRLIVTLPFKRQAPQLGDSLLQAKRRFHALEKRLSNNQSLYQQYANFIKEYIELGHMEIIPETERIQPNEKLFYMPHHGVIKESSATTKLRVVFDGSAKTTTGNSLNDELMIGPTIQQSISEIILRYRKYKYVFSADIEKMYRQFLVKREQTDYQRILWRDSPTMPLDHYRLLTVTYGTSSAPFMATYSLHYIADHIGEMYPKAAKVIKSDFYVDDLMSGADTLDEALNLQKQLITTLQPFGLKLRKWSANHADLLKHLPQNELEISCKEFNDGLKTISTLGIYYQPRQDTFRFRVNLPKSSHTTKRQLLSEASRLFDPIGWLSPTTITVKCLFQQLWLEKLDWDDEIPDKHEVIWSEFRNELKIIEDIKIPRWLNTNGVFEIHGFADASKDAYAAVLYSRSILSNGINVNLITAKTKVAPIKTISIPKLELCAAALLVKLLESTITSLMLTYKPRVFLYTDSTIVLNWLSKQPNSWPTYIANRTSQILSVTNRNQWHHISTKENPADCASRGMSARGLKNYELWWSGPTFLHSDPINLKADVDGLATLKVEDLQNSITMICKTSECSDFANEIDLMASRISKYLVIVRVLARIRRLLLLSHITKTTNQTNNRMITVDDLVWAESKLFSLIQIQHFRAEIDLLREGIQPTKGKLLNFFPFLDTNGLLRVSGRLKNAPLQYDTKHPIILPGDHPTIEKMVTYLHLQLLHAGPSQLLSHIRQRFQILRARALVKKVIHKCLRCHRQRLKEQAQLMGQLPTSRVLLVRPFVRSGVDYAGPYSIKAHQQKNSKIIKGYLAIFVCMATRAVHFELVTNLSTESFLAALKRFQAVRGISSDIYSDNATNFVGAKNQLEAMEEFLKSVDVANKIQNWSIQQGTKWHFIPPAAPTFGGLWEAAVKSTKFHLRRVIGDTILNYEELLTFLKQIEAVLNSRPLCKDDDSEDPLTPAHFLIGHALTLVPERNLTEIKTNRLSRWQMLQKMVQHFWQRWHNEYLTSLNKLSKYTRIETQPEIDDIVILKDDHTLPARWPLAKIIKVHPGPDKLVRVVTLQTSKGIFKRPIKKICLLPNVDSIESRAAE